MSLSWGLRIADWIARGESVGYIGGTMKILVTAGPTREAIDPVRFISNRSSGKMGYAIASAALARGHGVTLVSGPVCLPPPAGVKLVKVETVDGMLEAVRTGLAWADVLVMAAAVSDWKPAKVCASKLKKTGGAITLELVPAPDVLASVRELKGQRIFVGFAAETDNLLAEARRKLVAKGLDMIVANDVTRPDSGFEVDTNKVTFLTNSGALDLPVLPKAEVGARIIEWIEETARARIAG